MVPYVGLYVVGCSVGNVGCEVVGGNVLMLGVADGEYDGDFEGTIDGEFVLEHSSCNLYIPASPWNPSIEMMYNPMYCNGSDMRYDP